MLNSNRHFFAFRFTKNCYENINAKEDEVTTYSFYYAHYKLQNFFISPQSFFPTKTLYIRFCQSITLISSNSANYTSWLEATVLTYFTRCIHFTYIWNGQFTVKIKLISIWLAIFSTKNHFHFILFLHIFK